MIRESDKAIRYHKMAAGFVISIKNNPNMRGIRNYKSKKPRDHDSTGVPNVKHIPTKHLVVG